MSNIDPRSLRVVRGDGWDSDFSEYFFSSDDDARKLRHLLRDPAYTVKDTDLSYKVVNQWTQKGLLKDRREEEKSSWRRLTIVDLVWGRVLSELRSYGLPLEKLTLAFESLFFVNANKDEPCELLELGISYCLRGVQAYVVVFSDGWAEICTDRELKLSKVLFEEHTSELRINLNRCVKTLIPKISDPESMCFETTLTQSEKKVIEEIRRGRLDKLEVVLEDGQITRLDRYFQESIKGSDLEALAAKVLYGELRVVRRQGKNIIVKYRDVQKV